MRSLRRTRGERCELRRPVGPIGSTDRAWTLTQGQGQARALYSLHAAIRTIVLTLAIAVPACAPRRSRWPRAGRVTIQILAINDLHGHLEPPPGSNGRSTRSMRAAPSTWRRISAGDRAAAELDRGRRRRPGRRVAAGLVDLSRRAGDRGARMPCPLRSRRSAITSSTKGFDELLRLKRGGCHPVDGCRDGDGFDGARFEFLSANVVRRQWWPGPVSRGRHPDRRRREDRLHRHHHGGDRPDCPAFGHARPRVPRRGGRPRTAQPS